MILHFLPNFCPIFALWSRLNFFEVAFESMNEWDTPRNFNPPANKEESRNDPKIKEKSNFLIEWKFLENGQIDELHPHVDEFVRWLSQQKNEKSLPSTTP